MKKAFVILIAALLLCVSCTALAIFPDQLIGYQSKQKTWQYIEFGSYPTEADGTVRPILWRVLTAKDHQAYLMSEYILFAHRIDPNCYPVNKDSKPYGGWETSELFNYLNDDFLNAAFTGAEQNVLKAQEDGGLVSLMDIGDVKNKTYGFTAEKIRQAQSTAYAKANGLYVYQGAKQYSPYWSRTPSDSKKYAHRRVMDDGKLGYICVEVQNLGVRPVVYLDLSKLVTLEGEGTKENPFLPVLYVTESETPAIPEQDTAETAETAETAADAPADEPAPAEEPEEAPAAAAKFESEHAGMFPALTDEGFLPAGEPEYILDDDAAGIWLYASQDLRVEIVRKESKANKKRPWRWFEADLYVRPGSDEYLRVFYHNNDPKSKKTVEINEIAYENHLVFSMNADWYYYRVQRNAKKKVMPVGIIIRQGKILYNDPAKKLWTTIPNRDILAIYPDGNMEVYDYNGIKADELVAKGATDVLSFGPVLLSNGEVTKQTLDISDRQKDNPRSGIGMVAPGHYVSIVMEGKRQVSSGCTVKEFAELFQAKGCQVAYNLDGGGTASMMFMGKYLNKMGQFQANARKQVEALGLGTSELVQKPAQD